MGHQDYQGTTQKQVHANIHMRHRCCASIYLANLIAGGSVKSRFRSEGLRVPYRAVRPAVLVHHMSPQLCRTANKRRRTCLPCLLYFIQLQLFSIPKSRKRPGNNSDVDNGSWDCFWRRAHCLPPLNGALSTSLLLGL